MRAEEQAAAGSASVAIDYYRATAWRSDQDTRPRRRGQLEQRSRSFRFQWAAGLKLSKEYVSDLVPGDFLETWPPGQDEDTNWYVGEGRGGGKKRVPTARINQESIRWATLPSSSWCWLVVKGFAKFLSTIGLGFITLASISMVFMLGRSWQSVFLDSYLPVVIYVGGPSAQ